jgi:predicted DNA-binding transcriptional regulator AlpA
MHISPSTLARLSDEGKAPPSLRIGRRRLWAAADIASWLTAQTATAGGQK